MDALTTERSFKLQATWVIGILALFFTCYLWVFLYNQALADVRSTAAGIDCL